LSTFKIDLKTKIIADDTRAFITRAGAKGHLFAQVARRKAIAPDLPNLGLDLREGLAGDKQLVAKINRSRALKTWIQSSKMERGAPPTSNINSYSNEHKPTGHGQIEGFIQKFFEEIRKGDVVVIPHPSPYGKAIIAELGPIPKAPIKLDGMGRFEGYTYDGRPFKHFVEIPMTRLPRAIIDVTQMPGAVAEIKDRRVRDFIFTKCYPNYVLDDVFSSRISTTKQEFKPLDAAVLNAFITMISHNIAILEEDGDTSKLIGLEKAAFLDLDDGAPDVRMVINSPGYIDTIARTIAPLVTSAMLAIIIGGNFDAGAIAQDVVVNVTNSGAEPQDLCNVEVSRLTETMLKFLPEEEFKRSCELLKEAHESTGANSDVKVDVEK